MSIMESKKEHIKNAGLKVTTPRVVILGIFEQKSNSHFSAEDLYHILVQNGYDFSLATVYRVLTQFEKAGMLIKHRFEEEKSVYELSSDKHHDHLVCVKCGIIEEFNDLIIEQRQTEVAKQFNFKMTAHNLSLYGLCKVCQ